MSLSSSVRLLFLGLRHFSSTARLFLSSSLFSREETWHGWVEGLKYFGNSPGITSFLPQGDFLMDEASKCALQIRGFFWFWNSGSLRLQKFFHSLLKCPSEGKQKKERSGRFLELFKQFATQQKFTMTSAKLGAFQLTMKLVNASVFFNFPRGPLSLVYMQVPSSQERVSKNFERTLLKLSFGDMLSYFLTCWLLWK